MTLRLRSPDVSTFAWPGWRAASGGLLLVFELGSLILLGRPVDKEVLPIAVTLIIWESQKERQGRRSSPSQSRNGESD